MSSAVDKVAKPARDLEVPELQGLIQEAVYQGVMKAVAVYFVISLVVGVIVWLIQASLSE